MQNPHCYFSMDEPMGSFSPVQDDVYGGFQLLFVADVEVHNFVMLKLNL